MALTVEQIRERSGIERVAALTDPQIQALLDATSLVLDAQGLNPAALNYETIYDRANFMLFEWYAANPSMLTELTQGRFTEIYAKDIPQVILLALRPIKVSAFGEWTREGGF